MPFLQNSINALGVPRWPVSIRHPLVKVLVKRKKINSLHYRTKVDGLWCDEDAANIIDYHVLTRGAFEPGLTQLLKDWSIYHDRNLLLDIGANSGLHSIGLSDSYELIHAFEPYPPMILRLKNSIEINHIKNVIIHELGLSDTNGLVQFQEPDPGNTGTGRIVIKTTSTNEKTIEITSAIGDEILANEPRAISAVKIDVEGLELSALRGLRNRLKEDRPLVAVEILTASKQSHDQIKAVLPDGYIYYTIERIKKKKYFLQEWTGDAGDILALPKEHSGFVQDKIHTA
jgi:FkbM family methyltransferase